MHCCATRLFLGHAALTAIACASTTTEAEPSSPAVASAAGASAADASAVGASPGEPEPTTPATARDEHAPLVREIASAYRSWGMVDDQLHWAPGLCALPMSGVAHYSAAQAPGAHAEKVFMLYASDTAAYWRAAGLKERLPDTLARHALSSRKDVVQVLVKESFAPAKLGEGGALGPHGVRPAKKGDELFTTGDPIGLFVMAQLEGRPAGTDDGWIYATVAKSGEVTEAGVIASCRDCHAKEADRVFGVPLAWK